MNKVEGKGSTILAAEENMLTANMMLPTESRSDSKEEIEQYGIDIQWVFPRHQSGLRCCVYKDRAITKYRLMAILGHAIEDENDELTPLRHYAQEALNRDEVASPILTVLDEACSACLRARHFVTNVCRGCVARPCVINCPKDAVHIVDGQAKIDSVMIERDEAYD